MAFVVVLVCVAELEPDPEAIWLFNERVGDLVLELELAVAVALSWLAV